MSLLSIQNLSVEFQRDRRAVRVVDNLSLEVNAGEVVGLVGESGSGKSVTALSVARLLPESTARYAGGRILVEGEDVLQLSERPLRRLRGAVVSYVFQDPGASLNPVFRIGSQIQETLRLHRPSEATDAEVIRLLTCVGIPAPELRVRSYPHELSGGMQQRVMLALALAPRPKLLIADEPTTALDVTVQAQMIDLLQRLREELGMAMLLITHNLGIVGDIADRLAVMYAGQIVETGPARDVLWSPKHPYTQGLVNSVPRLGDARARLASIPGGVPAPGDWPMGCRFHPRCAQARPACAVTSPDLSLVAGQRWSRCPWIA